jgi:hypothetical protein
MGMLLWIEVTPKEHQEFLAPGAMRLETADEIYLPKYHLKMLHSLLHLNNIRAILSTL